MGVIIYKNLVDSISSYQNNKELLKQDLRIEANSGDLTRMVEQQMIGYTYRGVFVAIDENVQELTIA